MSDETTTTEQPAAQKNDFETRLASMSDEQAAGVAKAVADDQARRHQSAADTETITRGDDHAARETIRRKYGYTPQF